MSNRTTFIQKTIYRGTLIIYIMATIAGWFGISPANTKIKFDKLSVEQEITGWGTSSCWWGQIAGASENAEELAKLIFSEEGLGLNIFRYNVGAGERENPDSRLAKDSWRSSESFLVYNEETETYEYDWTQDEAARKILDLALSYGCVDTVVLFANSPHYSMTVSGQASGGFQDYVSNLKKDCYDDYVDYFLDITEHFIEMGVPVKYISPINEPQWSWGGSWVGQEGCHYEVDEVIALAKMFAAEIKERDLDVKLSMAESGQVGDHAMDCADLLMADPEIAEVMGTYAYHSYWTGDLHLKKAFGDYLQKKYPLMDVEMSEWCELPCEHTIDSIEAGLIMARTISEDMALTGCNSWSSWVAVNEGGKKADSMISANKDCSEYEISKRYYAMAHYSKFVPAGSHMVDFDISVADVKSEKAWWTQWIDDKEYDVYLTTNNMNVSCYKTPDGDYVAVIVNEGCDKKVKFNMLGYDMTVYTTDSEKNLELTHEGKGHKKLAIGENSITTVVFSK